MLTKMIHSPQTPKSKSRHIHYCIPREVYHHRSQRTALYLWVADGINGNVSYISGSEWGRKLNLFSVYNEQGLSSKWMIYTHHDTHSINGKAQHISGRWVSLICSWQAALISTKMILSPSNCLLSDSHPVMCISKSRPYVRNSRHWKDTPHFRKRG